MTLEYYVNANFGKDVPIICDSYEQTVDITRRLISAGAKHGSSGFSKKIAEGIESYTSYTKNYSVRHPFISKNLEIEYFFAGYNTDALVRKFYYSDFEEDTEDQEMKPVAEDISCIPDSFSYLKGAFDSRKEFE